MITLNETELYIKKEEGYRRLPYKCTAGKLTIGIGFNLTDTGLSEEESEAILHMRITALRRTLSKRWPWFDKLNEARQAAMLSMAYQMGVAGLAGFKNTLAHIEAGAWEAAATNMAASKWYRQTPNRARRTAFMVRYGKFPPEW